MDRAVPETVTYRKFRSINIEGFKFDIRKTAVLNSTEDDTHKLAENYIHGLTSLVHHHAPKVLRTITIRPNTAWYTEELRDDKRLRRRLERKNGGASNNIMTTSKLTMNNALLLL